MPQAVKCELLLYTDDTCLIFQHSDINEIESSNINEVIREVLVFCS